MGGEIDTGGEDAALLSSDDAAVPAPADEKRSITNLLRRYSSAKASNVFVLFTLLNRFSGDAPSDIDTDRSCRVNPEEEEGCGETPEEGGRVG